MNLLLITQKVDKNDSDLGFFHAWIERMAAQVDRLIVICLQKGEVDLPGNVTVLSLGKEKGASHISYLISFYQYIFRERYDSVFVHMNPEYAILCGLLWRLSGKKVALWYVHKSVNWKLRLAEKFVTKIFTASKESFRLPSRKVEVVGHGIDVAAIPVMQGVGNDVKLLSVGRISPSKDIETIILATAECIRQHPDRQISLDIIGEPVMAADHVYEKTLRELVTKLGLGGVIRFVGALPHQALVYEYAKHHVFIHTSKTGSIDKVVLEALAAGLQVLTSSEAYDDFGDLVRHFPANDSKKLAQSIEKVIENGILQPNLKGREFVKKGFDLNQLVERIIQYFN